MLMLYHSTIDPPQAVDELANPDRIVEIHSKISKMQQALIMETYNTVNTQRRADALGQVDSSRRSEAVKRAAAAVEIVEINEQRKTDKKRFQMDNKKRTYERILSEEAATSSRSIYHSRSYRDSHRYSSSHTVNHNRSHRHSRDSRSRSRDSRSRSRDSRSRDSRSRDSRSRDSRSRSRDSRSRSRSTSGNHESKPEREHASSRGGRARTESERHGEPEREQHASEPRDESDGSSTSTSTSSSSSTKDVDQAPGRDGSTSKHNLEDNRELKRDSEPLRHEGHANDSRERYGDGQRRPPLHKSGRDEHKKRRHDHHRENSKNFEELSFHQYDSKAYYYSSSKTTSSTETKWCFICLLKASWSLIVNDLRIKSLLLKQSFVNGTSPYLKQHSIGYNADSSLSHLIIYSFMFKTQKNKWSR